MKAPKVMTLCNLEVVVMPNGEVICKGKTLKTIGWVGDFGKFLKPQREEKRDA